MSPIRFRFTVGIVLALLMGCGGGSSSPTAPSTLSVAGTWNGSISDAIEGTGSAQLTIAQTGTSLSGTYGVNYPNIGNTSGTFTGSISGASMSATLTPSIPTVCTSAVTATVNGNQITGTYAATNCSASDSGSINLTKQ